MNQRTFIIYLKGRYWPSCGPIVDSVLACMRASRKAKGINQDDDHVIVGKPNPFAVDVVCKEHGITDRSKCIMIGDNPATDM